jgi:hypothetical protein
LVADVDRLRFFFREALDVGCGRFAYALRLVHVGGFDGEGVTSLRQQFAAAWRGRGEDETEVWWCWQVDLRG